MSDNTQDPFATEHEGPQLFGAVEDPEEEARFQLEVEKAAEMLRQADRPKGLFGKLAQLQASIGSVKKTGKGPGGQSYTYLTDRDITTAVNTHAAAVGISVVPSGFQIISDEPHGEKMRRVVIQSSWTIGDGETGEILTVTGVPSEAVATMDKSYTIALTYARRDTLRMIFNIAGEDANAPAGGGQRPQAAQQQQYTRQQAPPPAPPANGSAPKAEAPAQAPAVVQGEDPGEDPWGNQPVNWDQLKVWIAQALYLHGWTDKEERTEYARKHCSEALKAGNVNAGKNFYRQIRAGRHDRNKAAA